MYYIEITKADKGGFPVRFVKVGQEGPFKSLQVAESRAARIKRALNSFAAGCRFWADVLYVEREK